MTIFASILLFIGSVFCLLTSIGLLRFPDFYTRLQALTKASTFGLGLISLAVIFYFENLAVSPQAFLILAIVFITNPVGGHMLGRAAYFVGVPLWKETLVDELKGN